MDKNLEQYVDKVAEGIVLPKLGETGVGALKQQDAVDMALPPLRNIGSDPLVGYSTKALDAAMYAAQQRAAYAQTRAQLKRNQEVSKYEEKTIERGIKKAGRMNKTILGNISRATVRSRDSTARRMAMDGLGIDRSLFKVIR